MFKKRQTQTRDQVAVRAIAATVVGMLALFTIAGAEIADACAVCFGDPESPMTQGMKYGILVLLGFIGSVLVGFASLFLYWMHRSRQIQHLELENGATN